ncbi:CHASE2 domain-containing protein [Baaleninema simplex]|uniref:CHASE2 domain-containing protein n=1 Tax=Baaleninema simplex TaxID=2862350 RepID=UPI00034B6CBB|nr:adenylate/guanylate cyclase domain-containing protein [Baaleninema simplex]
MFSSESIDKPNLEARSLLRGRAPPLRYWLRLYRISKPNLEADIWHDCRLRSGKGRSRAAIATVNRQELEMFGAKFGQPLWQKLVEWRGAAVGGLGVGAIVLALRGLGWLQPLEWAAYDKFFLMRPPEPRDPRITIVGMTEGDIEMLGSPMSDEDLATLIETLAAFEPRAIGLDFYRNVPVEPGYDRLADVFESTPNLFGIEKKVADDRGQAIGPPPVLAENDRVAVNDVTIDADGKLRRGLLFLTDDNGVSRSSLGLVLAWLYLEAEPNFDPAAQTHPEYLQLGPAVFVPFEANDGGYVRADAGGYQILLNFRGPSGSFATVSVTEVLEGAIDGDLFRDRIVLIGPLAPSLNDFFYTPYSRSLFPDFFTSPDDTTGVEVQAHLTSQILSAALDDRPPIRVWPEPAEALWILAWSLSGAALVWRLRQQRWTVLAIALVAIALVAIAYGAFLLGWWIPLAPPLLGIVGSAVALTGYIAHLERHDRQLMMHLFGRHVTTTVAEEIWRQRHQILQEGRLVGQKATATVLFTDIKNFSTFAEEIDAEPLMQWLNEYMEGMAEVVLDNHGAIDKFIGDSVMAVFGVPIVRESEAEIAADAVAAVRCAVQMGQKLRELNQRWKRNGQPIISMRVGIATGPLVVGSLGSSQREDYTIIGDSVNVAARLESFDKELDGGLCRILIGESTYRYAQGQFPIQLLGSALLKGRQKPVKIYQVMWETSPMSPSTTSQKIT